MIGLVRNSIMTHATFDIARVNIGKLIVCDKNLLALKCLLSVVPEQQREQLILGISGEELRVLRSIIKSIKEVVLYRISTCKEHEAVRSNILSACCGPNVDLPALSAALGIYENRNWPKLKIYRSRRVAYLRGSTMDMSGDRYKGLHYGFPVEVIRVLQNWFLDDDCSTPDVRGRKVFYTDEHGNRTPKILRHMKAGDRDENHALFLKLRGEKCLAICSKSLSTSGRRMTPRVPGKTILESYRPNFVKYFKGTEFGECSLCKPAYDNYLLFKRCAEEIKPSIYLPETASLYVRSKVCLPTTGDRRHECEDNRCAQCSFVNYFIEDPMLSKEQKKYVCRTNFGEEYGIDFIWDSIVEWREFENVGVELPGKRKYEHLIYKACTGTMKQFLLIFQRACLKLKPHKIYQHRCDRRKLLSKTPNNRNLVDGVAAIYADYSENLKKLSGRSGTPTQYRYLPDFSLLNAPTFLRKKGGPIRIDYHCISDDPKHDTSLWPNSLLQIVRHIKLNNPQVCHFEITTDTSKKEFKSVAVFKRVLDSIVLPLNVSVSLCNFGPQHGKFLYDGCGRVWAERYKGRCVAELGIYADDLLRVVDYMNTNFDNAVAKSSDIIKRITLYTTPVEHKLSQWKSIPGTTQNHQFLLMSEYPNSFHFRRYWCGDCMACKKLDFLSCKARNCGSCKAYTFQRKSTSVKSKSIKGNKRDGVLVDKEDGKGKSKRKRGGIAILPVTGQPKKRRLR